MIGLRSWAVVCLIVLLCGRASAGEPDEAKSLIAKLKASLEAVETVQGTYRTYFSPKTPRSTNSIEPEAHPVPGAIAGPDSLVLYSEFDWTWQARPYREAIDGKWGYVSENRMHYTRPPFSSTAPQFALSTVTPREGWSSRLTILSPSGEIHFTSSALDSGSSLDAISISCSTAPSSSRFWTRLPTSRCSGVPSAIMVRTSS